MAPTHDLSFIHKRDDVELSDIPAGGIAGIVVGIILIVLVSVWCCCPCWKKRSPILSRDEHKEDDGQERGITMNGVDPQKTGDTTYSKNTSTATAGISPMTTGDGSGYGMRGGAGDRSTIVSALSTGDTIRGDEYCARELPSAVDGPNNTGLPGITEVDGRSHGGRINELNAAPALYEAPNTPPQTALSPPPRYEQIPRRPVAAPAAMELPAEVPASFHRVDKS